MKLDRDVIIDLGRQVYMGLSEQEIEELSDVVGNMVEETNVLNELDTSDVKPDVAVLDNYYNVFRKDEVVDYKEKELLLQNAKETYNNMFKIPKVM